MTDSNSKLSLADLIRATGVDLAVLGSTDIGRLIAGIPQFDQILHALDAFEGKLRETIPNYNGDDTDSQCALAAFAKMKLNLTYNEVMNLTPREFDAFLNLYVHEKAERKAFESASEPISARPTTFGQRVTLYRRRMGWTSEELAAKAGFSDRTIKAWEADKARPQANNLKTLAEALTVPVEDLE